jgi:hypothetical protein
VRRTIVRAASFLLLASVVAACSPTVSPGGASTSTTVTTPPGVIDSLPRPCSFLSQSVAAGISGDASVSNQARDVMEEYGYRACIFADTANEANTVGVQITRVAGGVDLSDLRDAATFFSRGEAVQPYQPFSAPGIGDDALGETTIGVAFVVFSRGDLLVYVGGDSAVVSPDSLRGAVIALAGHVAAQLSV